LRGRLTPKTKACSMIGGNPEAEGGEKRKKKGEEKKKRGRRGRN